MADKIVTLEMGNVEADGGSPVGKIVNVYSSYANALAHAATGLSTVKDVNRLTGAVGSSISQTAKTAGPTIDNNSKLVIALDDGGGTQEYFLACEAGRFGGPRRIIVNA